MKNFFAVLLAVVFWSGSVSAQEAGDTRTPMALTPTEKAYVLGQMRLFIESIQTIAAGLADGNRTEAGEAATARGLARNQGDPAFPQTLNAKLPPEWKQFGGSTRRGFDTLAHDISSSGDLNVAMKQLGEVMKNCVACHASYRITGAE